MKRSKVIDIMKGITIILVVIGHLLQYESYFWKLIFSFHMPIFFLLSGYCTYNSFKTKIPNFGKFLLKKIRNLYIPMVIGRFTIIWLTAGLSSILANIPSFLWNPGDWFLQTLFWSDMIIYFVFAIQKKIGAWHSRLISIFFIVVSPFVLYLSRMHYDYIALSLPFHYGMLSICMAFIFIGQLINITLTEINDPKNDNVNFFIQIRSFNILKIAPYLFIFGVIFVFYTKETSICNIATTYIGTSDLVFFAMALYMSFLVYLLSKYVEKTPFVSNCLSFVGKNSLWIYVGHSFINIFLVSLLSKKTGIEYTLMINVPWYYCIALFVIDFVVIVPLIIGYNYLIKSIKGFISKCKNKNELDSKI